KFQIHVRMPVQHRGLVLCDDLLSIVGMKKIISQAIYVSCKLIGTITQHAQVTWAEIHFTGKRIPIPQTIARSAHGVLETDIALGEGTQQLVSVLKVKQQTREH